MKEKYIYESPDGGKTVYRRKFKDQHRELVRFDNITRKELIEQVYNEITVDGLPRGGDLEALKLAKDIVDKGEFIK